MRTNRLNDMEQYIIRHGAVSCQELAETFHVSKNTIRRDIYALIARGKIGKVYGGVSVIADLARSPLLPFSQRADMASSEKQLIGKLAAQLVQDNSVIFLDSGSTTVCMIPFLAEKKGITLVTHNLFVMREAARYPSLNVLGLGGMLNHATSSFLGDLDPMLDKIHLQTLFMGASAISPQWGAGNNTYDEFKLKEKITQRCGSIILLSDHNKFNKVATYSYSPLSRFSALVTDCVPDQNLMEALQRSEVTLYCPEFPPKHSQRGA